MPFSKQDAGTFQALRLTVALWLFVLLIYFPMIVARHRDHSWASVALDASTIIVSMALAMLIFAVFRATLTWRLQTRAVILGITLIAIALTQTAFDFLFTGWIAQNVKATWASLPRNMRNSYGSAINYICVFGVNLALFQLSSARRRDEKQAQKLAEAQTAAQQAQLAALRFQLNPHFLFNTLNAISAMIVTGRTTEAEQMTDRLSNFLRTSLASDPTELIPFEDELALVDEYLQIEAVRFEERLRVEISCDSEAADVPVPSFLLQPLVENAIKYAVSPSLDPVLVQLSARVEAGYLVVTVRDDGGVAPTHPTAQGTNVGLNNIRRRLDALYGAEASLNAAALDRGFAATIRLPARKELAAIRPAPRPAHLQRA